MAKEQKCPQSTVLYTRKTCESPKFTLTALVNTNSLICCSYSPHLNPLRCFHDESLSGGVGIWMGSVHRRVAVTSLKGSSIPPSETERGKKDPGSGWSRVLMTNFPTWKQPRTQGLLGFQYGGGS